jgi:cytochrome c oxidase cbb3-type subunit 3
VEIAAGSDARTDFEKGRDLYNFYCYFCHGYAGDAKTLAATYLSPPPRDFTATPIEELTRARMIKSVSDGRPGTGMAGFKQTLNTVQVERVVDFIRQAFMGDDKPNTRYHTAGNGWPDHARYAIAFPFATGEIPLDTPVAELTSRQRQGRELFMDSCITCHDRARVEDEGTAWEPRAVSYPRSGYSHRRPDAVSAATPYSQHDLPPQVDDLSPRQRLGESLYQDNCAFCHAADGSGRNWIGAFLEPQPRNLTDKAQMQGMTTERLQAVIRDGLPNTTMPAWRHVLNRAQIEAVADYVMHVFVESAAEDAQ